MAGRISPMSGRRESLIILHKLNRLVRLPQAGEPNNPDFKEKPPDPKELHEYLSSMIFKNYPVAAVVRLLWEIWGKEFYSYQLLRPTTMPLKSGLLIIRQPWSAWRDSIRRYLSLSWIRACSLQEIMLRFGQGDRVDGAWPQNTLFQGATSSATGRWRNHQGLARVEGDDQRRSHRPSPCDLESPWLARVYGSPV